MFIEIIVSGSFYVGINVLSIIYQVYFGCFLEKQQVILEYNKQLKIT